MKMFYENVRSGVIFLLPVFGFSCNIKVIAIQSSIIYILGRGKAGLQTFCPVLAKEV